MVLGWKIFSEILSNNSFLNDLGVFSNNSEYSDNVIFSYNGSSQSEYENHVDPAQSDASQVEELIRSLFKDNKFVSDIFSSNEFLNDINVLSKNKLASDNALLSGNRLINFDNLIGTIDKFSVIDTLQALNLNIDSQTLEFHGDNQFDNLVNNLEIDIDDLVIVDSVTVDGGSFFDELTVEKLSLIDQLDLGGIKLCDTIDIGDISILKGMTLWEGDLSLGDLSLDFDADLNGGDLFGGIVSGIGGLLGGILGGIAGGIGGLLGGLFAGIGGLAGGIAAGFADVDGSFKLADTLKIIDTLNLSDFHFFENMEISLGATLDADLGIQMERSEENITVEQTIIQEFYDNENANPSTGGPQDCEPPEYDMWEDPMTSQDTAGFNTIGDMVQPAAFDPKDWIPSLDIDIDPSLVKLQLANEASFSDFHILNNMTVNSATNVSLDAAAELNRTETNTNNEENVIYQVADIEPNITITFGDIQGIVNMDELKVVVEEFVVDSLNDSFNSTNLLHREGD